MSLLLVLWPRLAIAAVSMSVALYQGTLLTLDGQRLMKSPRPKPFHMRWLVPTVCKDKVYRWRIISWLSLVAICVVWPGSLWEVALFAALPWFRTMVKAPVLTDAPAFLVSLAGPRIPGLAALPVAVVGAAISERVPVWMGLFSLRWDMAFVGLCAVAIAWKFAKSADREGTPALSTGMRRAGRWTDVRALLLPWGAGLAALLCPDWTLQEAMIVVVAYGQLLAAFDTSRLYMWASPVVLPKALTVIPARWRPIAVLVTWFNPYAQAPGGVLC